MVPSANRHRQLCNQCTEDTGYHKRTFPYLMHHVFPKPPELVNWHVGHTEWDGLLNGCIMHIPTGLFHNP